MLTYLLPILVIVGFPLSVRAQFSGDGERVTVKKGTQLCTNDQMEKAKGAMDREGVFWRVTSKVRANGTQTVAAYRREKLYDTKSGDTRIKDMVYRDDYATYFKNDPEHKGMLLMMSPQDDSVEAIVEVCGKKR